MAHFVTVDEYINSFSGETKKRLIEMRAITKKQLPDFEEKISYNIPAYFVAKKLVIYFAGYQNHIGMYPGRSKSAAYNELIGKYAHGKSTARFPHSEPLPKEIIIKFIRNRMNELQG